MWRNVRIAVLLLILIWAAAHTWLDRVRSTQWKEPLWVGIFPIAADRSPIAQSYIDSLSQSDFADIEGFVAHEAHRYGKTLTQPVHIELYPQVNLTPPELARDAGRASVIWWSMKMRWYAWHATDAHGRAPPRVRMFVLFHDPKTLQSVPDSHGMQKGLIGVVHAFALPNMAGSNNIVIAHEMLHTLGATDKYDPATGQPLFPAGFAEPERKPLYPQEEAEIMAAQRPLSERVAEMPSSLRSVVVGPETAAEIRWTHR